MVAAQPMPMTYLDRERGLADVSDDDSRRFELFGGEEVVSPSPTTGHQRVSRNTVRVIDRFNELHGLGELFTAPTDVRLSAYDVVVPDICFISRERSSIIGEKSIEGAPDLVIEILSPSTQRQDRFRKFTLYATSGVREYWLIDIGARSLTLFTLQDGQFVSVPEQNGTIESTVLPGLRITIGHLFEGVQ